MIFEEIEAAQVDMTLQCLKIQVGEKIYLIALRDLGQALERKSIIPMKFRSCSEPQQTLSGQKTENHYNH